MTMHDVLTDIDRLELHIRNASSDLKQIKEELNKLHDQSYRLRTICLGLLAANEVKYRYGDNIEEARWRQMALQEWFNLLRQEVPEVAVYSSPTAALLEASSRLLDLKDFELAFTKLVAEGKKHGVRSGAQGGSGARHSGGN